MTKLRNSELCTALNRWPDFDDLHIKIDRFNAKLEEFGANYWFIWSESEEHNKNKSMALKRQLQAI